MSSTRKKILAIWRCLLEVLHVKQKIDSVRWTSVFINVTTG
jgi:hypothetical protein